ncbi:hypothetical protein TRIATDRAFT_258660 [Trichoderma atroviride IMI 206040]|uniref:Uncharacterized protein n=1 Tax=Hypocrea atroviridis (strain ATCC 20476 / IMI 206040) TaxID=452589 RepID=G9P2T7_HYPAI|nr:uncharacterized protein TRIATDRAFT_301331 [Trichoderma atroviride IMI 206040]EHK43551.1 hypothetical protein TRIATDRAFT_258660 [Trichoderma atroviride IMI 206040]
MKKKSSESRQGSSFAVLLAISRGWPGITHMLPLYTQPPTTRGCDDYIITCSGRNFGFSGPDGTTSAPCIHCNASMKYKILLVPLILNTDALSDPQS